MNGAYGREYFFGKQTCPRVDVELLAFVLADKSNTDSDNQDNSGYDADSYQRELPLHSKGDDKCRHESGQGLNRQRQHLRDASVDVIPVRCCLSGDRCDGLKVEVCDVLSQNVFDELDAQSFGGPDSSDKDAYLGYISSCVR